MLLLVCSVPICAAASAPEITRIAAENVKYRDRQQYGKEGGNKESKKEAYIR